MRSLKIFAVLLLASAACIAQSDSKSPVKAPVSFDKSAFDTTVNPCDDFYQYACGGWRKANPIPGDKSRWGRFNELAEYNLNTLHSILENASQTTNKRTANEQKVGDFYAACMDEKAANTLGSKPIQPQLGEIAKITNKKQLITTIAKFHSDGISALFGFGIRANQHDATQHIAAVDQGGTTLPDRDYYLKNDAKSVETREKYVAHVQKMFELLGESKEKATADAKSVMDLETKLAEAQMDRTLRRDPKATDHIIPVSELEAMAPNFDFKSYFVATGVSKFDKLNVGNPDFFKAVNKTLDTVPLDEWKTYLRWKVLNSAASWLSQPFFDANFEFTKYMTGAKEPEVRWKRCTSLTDRSLGEALGPIYVEKTFGKEGKERALKMVKAIEEAMDKDIHSLDWMSPETKKAALVKLSTVMNKIGYPDKWKDYSSVKIARNDLMGNIRNATKFEVNRNRNKLGKPVDKTEWGMTPPTVNAYYSPLQNNINFPAGILQPPFYSNSVDDAVNFGGIGVVIGHELTHGFDDQGRKFDAQGNLRDWWTEQDGKEFEKRAQCIVDEYSGFTAVKDDKGEVKLNGKLTLGENTADNGGLRLAYMALQSLMGDKFDQAIDGFTPAQRFFIGYAQIWCQNQTDQIARQLAITDPHSPGQWRVNGVVSNSPEFEKAFSCKPGDKMVREQQCRVW